MSDRDAEDLARTVAFERDVVTRTSTRIMPFAWGSGYFNDGYPRRWDSNFLWVDPPGRADATDLIDAAERMLGGIGLAHREIRVDDDAYGASLVPAFRAAGYNTDRLVVMASRADPKPSETGVLVEEVDLDSLRPTREIITRREPWGTNEETVQMLVAFSGELVRQVGARFYCARVEGDIASVCELYLVGDVGQVESVYTLEEFRGRGLARAVVRHAATVARSEGAELVFIQALDEDWPKELYAELGFQPIGHVWWFVKPS